MSFLDNLENNLKALESREERDPATIKEAEVRRNAERQAALAIAPLASALKSGPFTENLLVACRTLGHRHRTMVRITWLENTLRLDAKEIRLELKPTPAGIAATATTDGEPTFEQIIDLSKDDPQALATRWLATLPPPPPAQELPDEE